MEYKADELLDRADEKKRKMTKRKVGRQLEEKKEVGLDLTNQTPLSSPKCERARHDKIDELYNAGYALETERKQ